MAEPETAKTRMAATGVWAQARRLAGSALILLICIGIWEILVRALSVPVYLVPAPSRIMVNMISNYLRLLQASLQSLMAILAGFASAVIIGLPAAALMIYSRWFRQVIYPILLTAQMLPKVALAPLFIVWFGFGLLPKVLMTFLISFFPIVIDSLTGLNAVRPESLLLIRSMGGSRWQAFWTVRLPTAMPIIFGGLKVAITFATVGTVVAEFVGSDSGIGYVLVLARGNLDTVTVFSAIVWLILIGFLLFFAVEFAERLCLGKRGAGRVRELGAGL